MSVMARRQPKTKGHSGLRIDLPEGGRHVDTPLTAVN
jgi:hypothetical protein